VTHDSRDALSAVTADDQGDSPLSRQKVSSASRAFPGRQDQVAQVRAFVRLVLGPVPVLDEVVLLVSELSTNAIMHTASGDGGTFGVTIRRFVSSVHVEVRDSGSGRVPVALPQDTMSEEGRGLGLVDLVADSWGHSGNASGRSVYFELCW
jgi:anti-sigma regulatory factor (Ser/Thr protein kinase)